MKMHVANFTKLTQTSQLCKVFKNQTTGICVDQAPNHFPLPRAGMKWGGNRDPPCSADTEPLTTRNPRKDYLTQMFISSPFLCLLRFQYNHTFSLCLWLLENNDYISNIQKPPELIAK